MAKTYQVTTTRRLANWLMTRLLRLGVPVRNTYLLEVVGRRSGNRRTTPVVLLFRDGERYLVSPYGEVNWVRNARAAGRVTLSRGRINEHVSTTELPPAEAAPVLRQYVQEVPIVRPYFDADHEASLDAFVDEAHRKPVFRLG